MNHKILSKNLTRPKNKAEAFALLQDIRKSVQDTNAIDETPLDELLLYFCTKPKPKARISWDWVALAAGRSDSRVQFNGINVIDGIMYGTDGHRIHYAHVGDSGIEDGFYTQCRANERSDYLLDKDRLKTMFLRAIESDSEDRWSPDFMTTSTYSEIDCCIFYKNKDLAIQKAYMDQALNAMADTVFLAKGKNGYKVDRIIGGHDLGKFTVMGMVV